MVVLLLLIGISLALSLLITPACRNAALRWKLVDVPDNARKIHRRPIPRIGGVPVALAYSGACLIVAAVSAHSGVGTHLWFSAVKAVAPAAVVVFLVGLADDIFTLGPLHKLAGEVLAGAIVVSGGVQIRDIVGFTLHPWLGAVVTVVWLVACANAINLIDGVDGLAAGIALLASGTTIVAALLDGRFELAVAIAPLAGALLGFLVFNFNPASIFLGDSGSLVLGFLLGYYSVLWSEKSATILGMTAPLIVLAIPLLDTSLAIIRRFLRRQPIFGADRSHIHHRLLARGLTPRRVTLLLYMATGVAGALSLCLGRVGGSWDGVIIVIFVCGAILGIQQLGYVEFGAARRLVLNGAFRRILNAQLAVQTFEEGLSAAVTPQECWAAIQSASRAFGFHQIQMQFAGHTFQYHNGVGPMRSWAIRIPISEEDWVELSHEFAPVGDSTAVVAFAQTIRKVLGPRSFVFARSGQHPETYSALAHSANS